MSADPHYWTGSLSMSAALALAALKQGNKDAAKTTLQTTLQDFKGSAACTPELKQYLEGAR